MSIRVRIGNQEHDLAQADKHWIISQIKDQQRDNGSVCVQVIINNGDVNLSLCSAGCPPAGGGGRQANPKEERILNLWEQHVRRESHLGGGEVVAFLSQLQRIV